MPDARSVMVNGVAFRLKHARCFRGPRKQDTDRYEPRSCRQAFATTSVSSSEAQCGGFCFRDHVMVVEPPSKSGMSSDLSVPDAEVRVGKIVSEAVLTGAPLN